MNDSDDSKKIGSNQELVTKINAVPIANSLPTPRIFDGKNYYATADIAKIIGVSRRTVSWWHTNGLFVADLRTHDGVYLYEIERVEQLKSVYHPKWMRGGYQPVPEVKVKPVEEDLIPPAETVRKKNIQLYPSRRLYFPNDAFSKTLFNLTQDDYRKALEEQATLQVTEKKKHKRFGDIITPYRIRVDDNNNFTLSEPLDQFHFAILCACISEMYAKNFHSTDSVIYRAITGKVGRGNAEPSKDQRAAITSAIDKLMRTQIGINMTKACENLDYNDGKAFKTVSAILPCKRVTEITINGKEAGKESTYIYFDRVSPLWEIASDIKNGQVLSCDAALLDMPRQQNTVMNIGVKFYTLRRVLESIAHPRQMVPIITFTDVFQKCRLENVHKEIKRRVRELMVAFFEHLQNQKLIKTFEVTKRGTGFYSIEFTFDKNKK